MNNIVIEIGKIVKSKWVHILAVGVLAAVGPMFAAAGSNEPSVVNAIVVLLTGAVTAHGTNSYVKGS